MNLANGKSDSIHKADLDITNTDRQLQIDNLVAGDLSESDRTALIRWLEQSPERWRQCGIAFLEAQVWRESMADDTTCAEPIPDNEGVPKPAATRQTRRWTRLLVATTAISLAFVAGWMFRPMPTGQIVNSGPVQADQQDPPTRHLHLVKALRPPAQEFTLPILDVRLPDEHWARQHTIPDYVKSQWRESGYEVRERKGLIPIELANGSRVVVPMNRVKLTYRGSGVL